MSERQSIDPEELAMLDEEQAFLSKSTKTVRRVKIEKGNESITARFLPTEFGPKKWFYQRIAFHWIGKRPYYCERHTAPECGGNLEAPCGLCDFADQLNESHNRNAANAGFRAMANPQYILYCLIFEREKDGELEQIRGPERWKAWEFPMSKVSFATFLQLYRRSLTRQPDKGVLNLIKGNDIIVSLPGRDLAFQREDSQPISDAGDQDKFQELVNKIWESIQLPQQRGPTDEDVEKAIEKIEESIGGRSGGRSSGRGRRNDDDRGGDRRRRDDIDDEPPRRSRSVDDGDDAPPPRRSRSVDDADDAPPARRKSDDDDLDYNDKGPRRSDPEPEERRQTPPSVAASARPAAPAPPVMRSPPPPAARSTAPAPAPRSSAPPSVTSSNAPQPPQVRSKPEARTSAPAQSSIDDDDNVTEETNDPAPTATPEDAGTAVGNEAPPAVAASPEATAAMTPPRIKDRLTRGIAAAKERA